MIFLNIEVSELLQLLQQYGINIKYKILNIKYFCFFNSMTIYFGIM